MDLSQFTKFNVFLIAGKRKMPQGEFPLTEEAHQTKGPCGVNYTFQFKLMDDHVVVDITANVPAGLKVSPGLVTETAEAHKAQVIMTEKNIMGDEPSMFSVPPFGKAVYSVELAK
jgi:hypothetical protein